MLRQEKETGSRLRSLPPARTVPTGLKASSCNAQYRQTDIQTGRTQHTDAQDEHKQGPEQFMGEKEREGLVACGLNACALSKTIDQHRWE